MLNLVYYLKNCFCFCWQPDWKLADPVCTFLFSIVVLITTLNILRDTIHVLMEGIVIYKLAISYVKLIEVLAYLFRHDDTFKSMLFECTAIYNVWKPFLLCWLC